MAFTYDTTTDRGRVRLLLGDTDSDNALFDDDAMDAFLSLGNDEVLLAAAFGADGIASSEKIILKVITIMDLKTDGATLAREWRMQAAAWRAVHAEGVGEEGDDFDIAEMVVDPFSARERIRNQALRV